MPANLAAQADNVEVLANRHSAEIAALADKHASEAAQVQARHAQEKHTAIEGLLQLHAEATAAASVQFRQLKEVRAWLRVTGFDAPT